MGDIGIIARRLEGENYVQYGYAGSDGYFKVLGGRLLYWYDTPEMVEYLFHLGQLELIGKPYSEKGGEALVNTNYLTGEPHHLGRSEREIFSKIMFIDFGYFFDTDKTWYYVIPGPFRIKMPLKLIENHLDEQHFEFDYRDFVCKELAKYLLGEYFEENETFRDYVIENEQMGVEEFRKAILDAESSIHELFEKHRKVFSYFDDWVVVKTDDCKELTGFIVREKAAEHIETCFWE